MTWLLLQNSLLHPLAEASFLLATSADFWVAHVGGVFILATGLVAWLIGHRLTRPVCTAIWVIFGVMLTALICHLVGDGGLLTLWLAAGGVVAGALGLALYRFFLAIVLCLFLAAVAPSMVYLVQGSEPAQPTAAPSQAHATHPPPIPPDDNANTLSIAQNIREKTAEATENAHEKLGDTGEQAASIIAHTAKQAVKATSDMLSKDKPAQPTPNASIDPAVPDPRETPTATTTTAGHATSEQSAPPASPSGDVDQTNRPNDSVEAWLRDGKALVQGLWPAIAHWWNNISEGSQNTLLIATILGGIIGLGLGLVAPSIGSAVGTALLGTLCMAIGSVWMLSYDYPKAIEILADNPPMFLLIIVLTTFIGFALQWGPLHALTKS